MLDSIIQTDKKCFMCGRADVLHKHHVFGAANRKNSEKYGLWIWLCPSHHNMSDAGVHFNRALDLQIKQIAQREFEDTHTRDDFMSIFGRNYL